MIANWQRWEPIEGLENKYWVKSVSYDLKGFNVILTGSIDKNKKLRLGFERVESYMDTDETFQYKLICTLREKYNQDFYGKWTFFIVNDSPYIKYLSDQSYSFSDGMPLKHFVLIAADSVINIISDDEPEVTFVVD